MAKTYSCFLVGLEVVEVEIEAFVGLGFSGLCILGLKSDVLRDMRERVRSALESIGIPIPAKRVVVNISATEMPKLSRTPLQELDFAVAACIVLALFQEQGIPLPSIGKEFFAGELTLTGQIKSVQNTLIYEKLFITQKHQQFAISMHIPPYSIREEYEKCFSKNYVSLGDWLSERKYQKNIEANIMNNSANDSNSVLFEQNKIQKDSISTEIVQNIVENIKILLKNPKACVAVLIAVAGKHHLLLAGEPGIGKSFSINKIKNILIPPSPEEQIEIKLIHFNKSDVWERPFRSPHHSASVAALIGGQSLKPGEVTLAHHGVLFLDEIAEFSRSALEALREPLDSAKVELSKVAGSVSFPAQFLLCATTNPCPCGYFLSSVKPCQCMPTDSRKYMTKISGPLLDRFCLQVWLENVNQNAKLKTDIFSEFMLSLTDNELYNFAEKFLQIQKYNRFKSANAQSSAIKHNYGYLNFRAQNKIQNLIETFSQIFSTLTCENNFTDEVLKYRNFGQIFDQNLVY